MEEIKNINRQGSRQHNTGPNLYTVLVRYGRVDGNSSKFGRKIGGNTCGGIS
jgi:hypothetical protein